MQRNSIIAVILLVVLRLAIGWQLLYEGLWKLDTLDSSRPWSSAGYLKNAEGPFRDTFRSMAGDPDDLDWLNYDIVAARWDDWAQRFRSRYDLSNDQSKRLDKLLNGAFGTVDGRPVYAAELTSLPEGVTNLRDAARVSDKNVWYDPKRKRLYVDGKSHLKDSERDKLLRIVKGRNDAASKQYEKAVQDVYKRQKRGIGYKEKLAGALRGNPDLLGVQLKPYADSQRVGQKQQYQAMLARHENLRDNAETHFQWDHLQSDWRKIQSLRTEIIAPVKSLETEFHNKAMKLLTVNQFEGGSQSKPWSMLRVADLTTMWGLAILGTLLISGLFTRLAAIAAAGMLFSFYLAMPPLPGVPEIPGPEHSYIINKNLIEVIALLAIASLPTGRWFGMDAWFRGQKARAEVGTAST
ncbi:MAG: DoxX family protein [Fuerstiella sp.]|nr:DoxX family protein [Fuerstiella sp.]